MSAWIGTLARGWEQNWLTCKRSRMWGTTAPRGTAVREGDELYVWQAGAGWLARCRALSDAWAPTGVEQVPWPEPERYRALFDIEVLDELATPAWVPGPALQEQFGVHTIQLAQFPPVRDPIALQRLRDLFPGSDSGTAGVRPPRRR